MEARLVRHGEVPLLPGRRHHGRPRTPAQLRELHCGRIDVRNAKPPIPTFLHQRDELRIPRGPERAICDFDELLFPRPLTQS